jgi:hypothetical protein
MSQILLGETRREAINRVQERLGPVASRPLAEQTFWALAKKGKITMDPQNGSYLIEAELDDESIKQEATQSIEQATKQQNRFMRSRGNHFTLNHKSMHQARVSTSWHPSTTSAHLKAMISALSPVYSQDDSPDDDE